MVGGAYGAAFFTAGLTAPLWGRLGDRYGRKLMLIRASLGMAVAMTLLGMAQSVWQLVALRFCIGLELGGLLPCIASVIRHSVSAAKVGGVLGLSTSAQYVGQVTGPLLGGVVGGHLGMRPVFLGTCLLLTIGAGFNQLCRNAAAVWRGTFRVGRDGRTNNKNCVMVPRRHARVGEGGLWEAHRGLGFMGRAWDVAVDPALVCWAVCVA